MSFTNKSKQKGFTLLELIIVLAVLSVLAVALFLIINPPELLRKARDAKRMADLATLNKALAHALANGEITLPSATVTGNSSTNPDLSVSSVAGTPASGWLGGFDGSLSSFISKLPKDPRNGEPLENGSGEV